MRRTPFDERTYKYKWKTIRVDLLQITYLSVVAAENNKKGQIEQGKGIEKTTNFLTNGQNSPI